MDSSSSFPRLRWICHVPSSYRCFALELRVVLRYAPQSISTKGSIMRLRHKCSFFLSLLLAALCIFQVSMSTAQTSLATGRLDGTVFDKTGAAFPGATANLRNQGTGVNFSQSTDESGRVTFLNLEPGSYELTIER